jgi:hypothetical protein
MRMRATFLALVLATLAGCELFKPATPEPPPPDPVETNYTSPASVLETVRDAIEAKNRVNAAKAYEDAFGDPIPTTSGGDGRGYWAFVEENVLATFNPRPVSPRNFEQELQFYSRLVTVREEAYQMTWVQDPIHVDQPGDDDRILHRVYTIRAVPPSGASIDVARGIADLYLHRVSTRWVIVRWDDRRDPDFPNSTTLGILRLRSQ